MKTVIHKIRSTSICLITAIAIAAPGLASAGCWTGAVRHPDRKNPHRHSPSPMCSNIGRWPIGRHRQGPGRRNLRPVKQLKVVEQLKQTMGLVQQMQADYEYFSGGEGCAATCAAFRSSLKNTFNSFALLVSELPALSSESGLVENMQRVSNLIDYLPPRALYLLWQAMSAQNGGTGDSER